MKRKSSPRSSKNNNSQQRAVEPVKASKSARLKNRQDLCRERKNKDPRSKRA